ncbi:MAG TPA: DoxX family membrane protein, partial [Acidobacteriota bacterium]|nr:DoxX family membrane protein [Acidobacteriota bacterium]
MGESGRPSFSHVQEVLLFALRFVVGWHLLYEGLVKVFDPQWTAGPFLLESSGPLAGLFHWTARTPWALAWTDTLNAWGLTLIGAGLLAGVAVRAASIAGAGLLALYYLANPPWIGFSSGFPTEGNYLIFDKNFIEMLALAV